MSKRRERIDAFKKSGIVGTPAYQSVLRQGLVLVILFLGCGIYYTVYYSSKSNVASTIVSVILLGIGAFLAALYVRALCRHLSVKRSAGGRGTS